MAATETTAMQAVEKMYDCFNRGDLDTIKSEVFAPDIKWTLPGRHPLGGVKNVTPWRLVLSKGLSRLYRLVLHQPLHTYTSCFRVYRREAALGLSVRRGGFFGVTEMLGQMDLAGRRIVEFPTTLEARMLGRSKMKVLRTIAGHLGLLSQLLWLRVRGARRAGPA